MFRLDRPPVYQTQVTKRSSPSQTEQTIQQLRTLSCRLITPKNPQPGQRTQPPRHSPPSHKILYLNQASDAQIVQALTYVHGIGTLSINRIITQRSLNGNFISAQDFDHRVARLSFTKLQRLCAHHSITLSLLTAIVRASQISPITPPASTSTVTAQPVFQKHPTQARDIVITSWNATHLSHKRSSFLNKMDHLVVCVRDADTAILVLQEVSLSSIPAIQKQLSIHSSSAWTSYIEPSAHASLAILFQPSRLSVTSCKPAIPLPPAFARPPQIARLADHDGNTIIIVNVHLSQSDPAPEVLALSDVVSGLQDSSECVCVIGDFNVDGNAHAFDPFLENNFVDLFRPVGTGTPPHGFRVVETRTTFGGICVDNFWIHARFRHLIGNAWCFRFAGRGKDLRQSSHAHAAERRAASSDHFPIVLCLRMDRGTAPLN